MEICKLFIFITLLSFFSCQKEFNDGEFKIYHLKPNDIQINTDTLRSHGWYSKKRYDFFAIKNFDNQNEQHKIKIDSFVINYIKKDSFLIKNSNSSWALIFYKYGNGITENTKHEYNTDYTIHNLFAFKKRMVYYHFTTKKYDQDDIAYYFKNGDSIVHEKRKIITKYLKTKPLVRNTLEDK